MTTDTTNWSWAGNPSHVAGSPHPSSAIGVVCYDHSDIVTLRLTTTPTGRDEIKTRVGELTAAAVLEHADDDAPPLVRYRRLLESVVPLRAEKSALQTLLADISVTFHSDAMLESSSPAKFLADLTDDELRTRMRLQEIERQLKAIEGVVAEAKGLAEAEIGRQSRTQSQHAIRGLESQRADIVGDLLSSVSGCLTQLRSVDTAINLLRSGGAQHTIRLDESAFLATT